MSDFGMIERDVAKPEVTELNDYNGSLRLARIIEVFDASHLNSSLSKEKSRYGKVRILWLDGTGYVPRDLDVTKSWFSWKRGAAIVAMPEVDDIVVCLERPGGYPVILGFLPLRWDAASKKVISSNDDTIGRIRPLHKGEILVKSSYQGEVFLSKEGNVKISAVDPTSTSKVVTSLNGNSTEDIFDRVNDTPKLIECTIGYDFINESTVKVAGSSPQVFSVGTHYNSLITMSFPFEKEITFFLYEDTVIDSVESVVITSESTKSGSEQIEPSRYDLKVTPIYAPSSTDASSEILYPCTAEKNSYLYKLTFNDNVRHTQKDIVTININTKKFIGGVRVNSLGDVFIDGRNVVIRSKDGKSSALFSDSGQTSLRGIRTELGNINEGIVVCDSSGVKIYKGVFPGSDVHEESTASIVDKSGTYFYVTDAYPLLKLYSSWGTWHIDGVSKEEYNKLDDSIKASINKMWISSVSSTGCITQDSLTKLLKDGFPSYAELKS